MKATLERAAEALKMNRYQEMTMEAAEELFGTEAREFDLKDLVLYDEAHDHRSLGYHFAVERGTSIISDDLMPFIDFEAYGKRLDGQMVGGFTSYGYLEYRA